MNARRATRITDLEEPSITGSQPSDQPDERPGTDEGEPVSMRTPMEFYQEMSARSDTREILKRLADL